MKPQPKLLKEIERRGLASFANNTRWGSFLRSIEDMGFTCRVKPVLWGGPSPWSGWLLPVDGYLEVTAAGPLPFREIEWIEFDTNGASLPESPSSVDLLIQQSASASLPITDDGTGVVRVWGYR